MSTQFKYQNSSIWSIDRTLSGATTPGQSGSGSDSNEGVLCIPQSSSIPGTSLSHCLVSYPKWGSYLSAEEQTVYSTAPADWTRSRKKSMMITTYVIASSSSVGTGLFLYLIRFSLSPIPRTFVSSRQKEAESRNLILEFIENPHSYSQVGWMSLSCQSSWPLRWPITCDYSKTWSELRDQACLVIRSPLDEMLNFFNSFFQIT